MSAPKIREIVEVAVQNMRKSQYKLTDGEAKIVVRRCVNAVTARMDNVLIDIIEEELKPLLSPYLIVVRFR